MQGSDIKSKSTIEYVASVLGSVVKGSVANTTANYMTLPLTSLFIERQTNPSLPMKSIAGNIFSATGLHRVYLQSAPNFLRWAGPKSIAYIGSATAFTDHYQFEPTMRGQIQKGVAAGSIAAVLESTVDGLALPKLISRMNGSQSTVAPSVAIPRCIAASFVKNSVANAITLSAIYGVKYELTNKTNLPNDSIAFFSGLSGPITAGPLIAPLVCLESRTARDPQKNMVQHLRTIVKQGNVRDLWNGGATRIVQRSLTSGLTFFGIHQIEKWLEQARTDNIRPSLSTEPSKGA